MKKQINQLKDYHQLVVRDTKTGKEFSINATELSSYIAPDISAEEVSYDNSDSGLTAVNVKTAIDEANNKIENFTQFMYIEGDLINGVFYKSNYGEDINGRRYYTKSNDALAKIWWNEIDMRYEYYYGEDILAYKPMEENAESPNWYDINTDDHWIHNVEDYLKPNDFQEAIERIALRTRRNTKVIEISSSELLALDGSPVQLLPPSGNGNYYHFHNVRLEFTYGSVAYASATASHLRIFSNVQYHDYLMLIAKQLITQNESCNSTGILTTNPHGTDEAIFLGTYPSGDFTTGNGTLRIVIDYEVISVGD